MDSESLYAVLKEHYTKRIIVVGTTCTGKSTILKDIQGAIDMDKLIFPMLSKEECELVCQTPWTNDIGMKMTQLVRNKVKVIPSKPLFGTIILDCDLIIFLKISDDKLLERCNKRGVNFSDAKNMQKYIEMEIALSKIDTIEFNVT